MPNANGSSSSEPLASSGLDARLQSRRSRLTHELGLADAGRSLDQEQRPSSSAGALKAFVQRPELSLALAQRPGRQRTTRHDDTPRPATARAETQGETLGVPPLWTLRRADIVPTTWTTRAS